MNEIDKLDGMVKTKKCGYEFIGGCKDLRSAKQKLEKIEPLAIGLMQTDYQHIRQVGGRILQIIRGEE